jgi:hypothetical protein
MMIGYRMYSGDDDPEDDVVIASGRIPPPGRAGDDEEPSRPAPAIGNVPSGARVEVNEMDDGSLVWAVVKGLRRGSTMTLPDETLHSRQSSTASDMMQRPLDSPVDPLRLLIRHASVQGAMHGQSVDQHVDHARPQSIVEVYEADDSTVGALISELSVSSLCPESAEPRLTFPRDRTSHMDSGKFDVERSPPLPR